MQHFKKILIVKLTAHESHVTENLYVTSLSSPLSLVQTYFYRPELRKLTSQVS
jgi:hypothetical protein